MSLGQTTSVHIHNASCETAAQANCQCFCHGAGHQNDMLDRAASCSSTAELHTFCANLHDLLGGFHKGFLDITTSTRGSRNVPKPGNIAALNLSVRGGATWCETLIVDEALHAAFIQVATMSLNSSQAVRDAQKAFIASVTTRAIPIVGSAITLSNVVESHVWCSVVAEHLALAAPPSSASMPSAYGAICYPRKSVAKQPSSLQRVRKQGLSHIASTFAGAKTIPAAQRVALLRLVGAATCPDLWHHPAAVRFSLFPFVASTSWPPRQTTVLATASEFGRLKNPWTRKGHW